MRKRTKNSTITTSRTRLKNHTQTKKSKAIEREYQQTFTPNPLPYRGLYTDPDSLEQPSALKNVPTTSAPNVEA